MFLSNRGSEGPVSLPRIVVAVSAVDWPLCTAGGLRLVDPGVLPVPRWTISREVVEIPAIEAPKSPGYNGYRLTNFLHLITEEVSFATLRGSGSVLHSHV
jgi:hypothetical protein